MWVRRVRLGTLWQRGYVWGYERYCYARTDNKINYLGSYFESRPLRQIFSYSTRHQGTARIRSSIQ
jgi:hypothetical protein